MFDALSAPGAGDLALGIDDGGRLAGVLTRTGALDDLLVRVEARAVLEGAAAGHSADELARRLKGMCGLSATVEIAVPGAVERSMGKARRVIDRRR